MSATMEAHADVLTPATLARAATRELAWGLRHVSREVGTWRARAAAIPDPTLRADALRAIVRKRGNINGAALFWTLPDERNRDLLELLVAYEILADYLDCASERGAHLGIANGRQLHLALGEALEPAATSSDYYLHHHSRDDGGYLSALVHSCRVGCATLPSYPRVQPLLARATGLLPVLALNHEPDPARRERALRRWALERCPTPTHLAPPASGDEPSAPIGHSWFERTAGASAWLTVHALLAQAADTRGTERTATDGERTYEGYLRWIAPTGAMLDSYGDIAEDRQAGDHSYIAHYPSLDVAVERMTELVCRSREEARALPNGSRHAVLNACMTAFYLSKDSVRVPAMRAHTARLTRAGGPLVAALVPVLRLWRSAYGQRSA